MNNFKDLIKDLHVTESLSDVTLVCNDDTEIKAHKFVLIGSSPVFRSMLLQSSQRDTIVYLRGVKRSELEWALQFMYLGHTQVPQTHLQTFIRLAKDLKMKGIHNEDDVQNDENISVQTMTPEVISNFDVADMERSMDEQKGKEVKDEREEQKPEVEKFPNLECGDNNVSTITQNKVRYTCNFCSFEAKGLKGQAKSNLNAHIERVHEGVRYPCDLCAYQANRQQNLKDHKAGVHKIDPFYRCLVCNFCTNHTKTWKRHAERMHPDCQPQEIFEVTPSQGQGQPRKKLSEEESFM